MATKRDYRAALNAIGNAMNAIERFVEGLGSAAELQSDDKTASAVIQKLELIGQCARSLPADWRERHAAIPWASFIAMQERLIEEYYAVDYSLIWQTIKRDLPNLKPVLQAIIAELTSECDK